MAIVVWLAAAPTPANHDAPLIRQIAANATDAAVNVFDAGMGASSCHESVRRNVILGTDETLLVDVDFDDSIVNRLERLLAHLEIVAPNNGWEAYRDASDAIRWDMVLIAGHSQGAGHAAFIGRLDS